MDRRVQSCVSGRTRGSREGAGKTVGIRQAGGCGTAVGKDPFGGLTGQGSADAGGPVCGQKPTADFAIAP